jgi:LuxR family maltose regulon positive regulatory protein
LLSGGELEGVEGRLRDAERWLDTTTGLGKGSQDPSAEMVVVDDVEFRRLPGMIELYRAALALARGDVLGTVRHSRKALDLSPEEDHLCRAAAAGLLGLASWASGDLEAGHRRIPNARLGCGGPGTSPTPSGARSRWRTYG